jgi:hypothetical protein
MRMVLWSLLVLEALAVPGMAAEVTPCDLVPNALVGATISVRADVIFTMHGAVLFSRSCTSKGQHSAVLMFPGDPGAPPVSFGLDPLTMAHLRPFFRTTGGQAVACGVFSGRVFYKKGFHLKTFRDVAIGNGFGENGAFRAAFVLKSAEEVHVCN